MVEYFVTKGKLVVRNGAPLVILDGEEKALSQVEFILWTSLHWNVLNKETLKAEFDRRMRKYNLNLDVSFEQTLNRLKTRELIVGKSDYLAVALIENAIKCVLQSRKEKTVKFKEEVIISDSELNLTKKELQVEVSILDRIRRNKEKLFQKLMDNKVTDDEYMKLSEELELEQITVENKIKELKKKQKAVLSKKNEKEFNLKIYKEIGEIKKIDRNVVEKLVDKMVVSKEGRVEIQWTFKEIFNSA